MLLVLDIGNTNITIGIFNQEKFVESFRIPSDRSFSQDDYEKLLLEIKKLYNVSECVIGSVVEEITYILKKSCDNVFDVNSYVIDKCSDYGMKILLETPSEVGIDRVANAYAAKNKYKLPAIVVDIGTATTFDIISKNGDFLGGVIMPGLDLQFKSLNLNTSKLPRITAGVSEQAIGKSTERALLSGIMRGSACAIEGLIHQCELELGEKATIIATGGCSGLLSEYMFRKFDYIDSNLTLDGLQGLYSLNKQVSV